MDFNDYKNSYVKTIENSLQFSGKEHDFFTKVKAEFLKDIIKKNLPDVRQPHLLDIGCGHGLIHKHLKDTGLNIVGVEMADEVVQLAQQSNPEVKYHSHDGKTLPFASQQFDIAITICVMHHVPPQQWRSFLQEMKRVVKPGGIAVIFEHNPYHPVTRYIVANNVLDEDAVLLSSPKLKKMMRDTGFASVQSRNILFTPFASRVFRWLDKMLGRVPLGTQYYSIGRV
jgi:2-polyprenyl-3-methyl-5-hydroxy-6-metoxy-1,4-benzoquinol methylase